MLHTLPEIPPPEVLSSDDGLKLPFCVTSYPCGEALCVGSNVCTVGAGVAVLARLSSMLGDVEADMDDVLIVVLLSDCWSAIIIKCVDRYSHSRYHQLQRIKLAQKNQLKKKNNRQIM